MRPAIYLHSTWRSASTYVWAKFRDRPEHCCFFEPLNEHLVDATPDFIDRFRPWSFANHPVLTAPYLEEFRPLLSPKGGLADFPAAFTFGHYCLERSERHPELQGHFERLERCARAEGRAPVFGCVRTDLRLAWCRANLPGVHIALRRDPRRQFLSCLAQAVGGNPYFLERGLVILAANRDEPAFAPLRAAVDIKLPLRFGDPDFSWAQLYMISYFLHRLAREQARHADLQIDLDGISADRDAARHAEELIERATGTAISFADCAIETYEALLARYDHVFTAIEADVHALTATPDRLAA